MDIRLRDLSRWRSGHCPFCDTPLRDIGDSRKYTRARWCDHCVGWVEMDEETMAVTGEHPAVSGR
jgi:hypothetical protein